MCTVAQLKVRHLPDTRYCTDYQYCLVAVKYSEYDSLLTVSKIIWRHFFPAARPDPSVMTMSGLVAHGTTGSDDRTQKSGTQLNKKPKQTSLVCGAISPQRRQGAQ